MIIPKNDDELIFFIQDTVQKCMNSQDDRRSAYEELRSYMLYGCEPGGEEAVFNKIRPHIDQLTSFLYSAESTQFSVDLGDAVPPAEQKKVPALRKRINSVWLDSNTDETFSTALQWALVYNSTFVKLTVDKNGAPHTFMVDPASIGVLREDVPYISRQEAICHVYYITKSELEDRLYRDERRSRILAEITTQKNEQADNSAYSGMVITNVTTNIQGRTGFPSGASLTYTPKIAEETIEMKELWVWDSEASDYRVFTIASPFVVIYDRTADEVFIKGELPFVQVAPNPLPDYFFGLSEVGLLRLLQKARNRRITEIFQLLAKQVAPPKVMFGFSGITDEKMFGLNRAGGYMAGDNPNAAKVQELAPTIPDDVFGMIREIDEMFSEASGITPILGGKGESGVRSGGHASQLARLGSSRAKKRALIVEDSLEKVATLMMRLIQKYDKSELLDDDHRKFIAEQFTRDYVVKVDAHSNSPIFMEDTRELAMNLYKAKVIDGASLLDLIDPPQKDLLKLKYQEMQKKQEEAAQAKAQQEAAMQAQKSQKGMQQ